MLLKSQFCRNNWIQKVTLFFIQFFWINSKKTILCFEYIFHSVTRKAYSFVILPFFVVDSISRDKARIHTVACTCIQNTQFQAFWKRNIFLYIYTFIQNINTKYKYTKFAWIKNFGMKTWLEIETAAKDAFRTQIWMGQNTKSWNLNFNHFSPLFYH